MPEHRHPEDEIMYVTEGTCRTPCLDYRDGQWHDVTLIEGCYINIKGGTLHNLFVERESPCRILNLEYTSVDYQDRNSVPWTVIRDDGSLLRILGIVHDKLRERDNGYYPDHESAEEDIGLATLLLERKIAQQREKPPMLHKHTDQYVAVAQEYIREHYAEELFVADIAGHVGIASAYLQRLFRQKIGMTISEYINGQRLNRSKYLLTHSELSLAVVAENAGFKSRQRLAQVFRAMEHCSPGEYRKTSHESAEET